MSTRPDKKQIKNLIKRARSIDSGLKVAIDTQKNEIADLRKAADTFLKSKLKSALVKMDVEMLSQGKLGIRVSCLKNAGINNIYQLSKMSQAKLEALDGIGAQSAIKIRELVDEIVNNTQKNYRCA